MKTASIILTVHNKDFMIKEVTRGILDNISSHTKELIVVFDGCNDNSRSIFEKTISQYSSLSLNIIILEAPDIWETKANNLALKESTCETSIIIQDDMVITENEFDKRLMKPILAFSDVFAVTGRTAHNDIIIDNELSFTNDIGRENPTGIKPGYLKRKIRKLFNIKQKPKRNIFGIRDIVNRGPLLIDNKCLNTLNYFDEAFAPLDLDDHDLCLRAYKEHGWLCGSYQMAYLSDLNWGGTRANPNSLKIWSESNKKNKKLIIDKYYNMLIGEKHDENRILE